MAEFSVPDSHRAAIIRLLKLSPDDVTHLFERLNACGATSSEIIEVLDDTVGDGPEVLRALVNFTVFPKRFDIPLEAVEPAIKQSFDEPDSTFPLAALLSLEGIRKLAKALDLRNSYENILVSTRIITDIRPVFSDGEVEDVVAAAMMNHTLQIRYRSSDQAPRDIFVALDTVDLKNLYQQIERAFDKEQSGTNFIQNSSAVVLKPLDLHAGMNEAP